MKKLLFSILVGAAVIGQSQAQVKVDPNLKTYEPVAGISGKLNTVGSDTCNNLMTFWSESFKKMYPSVHIQIEGKGSSTAPPALIAGAAQLGPMSRPMKSKEVDKFEKKFGYKPTRVKIAIDALAVFVHKDNPIKGLSLKQLDSIFSSTLKQGGQPITTWGQVGLTGDMSSARISLYGRNSASGTYGYFKKVAMKKGDYRTDVNEQPGSSAVVQAVGAAKNAIGYSGIGYKTSNVRALPLSTSGTAYKEPSMNNCIQGTYPIARFLNIYLNKRPNAKLDRLSAEFIRFVLSKQGQQIVVKDGFFPLPAKVANPQAEALK